MCVKILTIQEYKLMLERHDWYYMMSEDAGIYKAGAYSYSNIQGLSSTSKEHKELFNQQQDKHKIN